MGDIAPADRLVTLPPGIPDLTLGWHANWWATVYLRHPNGPRAGLNWEYTESQLRFVLWWYSIRHDGRFGYQHGVRRLSKGTGKSPGASALSLTELLGPVRFAGIADTDVPLLEGNGDNGLPAGWVQIGRVIGKPVAMPLVQIAGVSESATANTMRHVRAMTGKNSRVVRDYHLDPGKTVIYTPGGGQLEVITSSAASAEGAEVTAAFLDEPEHWTPASGGVELAATIDRNLAKSRLKGDRDGERVGTRLRVGGGGHVRRLGRAGRRAHQVRREDPLRRPGSAPGHRPDRRGDRSARGSSSLTATRTGWTRRSSGTGSCRCGPARMRPAGST